MPFVRLRLKIFEQYLKLDITDEASFAGYLVVLGKRCPRATTSPSRLYCGKYDNDNHANENGSRVYFVPDRVVARYDRCCRVTPHDVVKEDEEAGVN